MEKLKEAARVKSLIIYPVKSCVGVNIEAVEIKKKGGVCDFSSGIFDRSYCVVNAISGWFQSGLRIPGLFTIKPEIHDRKVVVRALFKPELGELTLPAAAELTEKKRVRVWGRWFEALDCGDVVATWFSAAVGSPDLRLVHTPPSMATWSPSQDKDNEDLNYGFTDETVSFQDLSPCNMLSTESLNELSACLGREVTHRNFRPNVVVEKCSSPREEDRWMDVVMGTAHMKFSKRCVRCRRTTVSEDGIIDKEKDVLNFLKMERSDFTYGGPCFAIDLSVQSEGRITVGDSVRVSYRD